MEVAESDKNETFWLYGDSDDESSLEEPVGDVAEVGTAADQAGPAGQVRTYIRKRSRKRARGGDAVRDGSGKLKKQYLPTTLSAEELAADVAASAGLPDHRLGEHEEGVLNDDIDEEMYFKIRNHILAMWRGDVSSYLSEQQAVARVQPKHKHLATSAWRFLDREGYINWGVAPAITDRAVQEQPETVVVIGSGLAGLSAARQLRNHGYKVVVLEGAERPGGRVHTHRLEGGGRTAVADLGGSVITGTDSNPLAVLARQLGIPLHNISDNVPLFLKDGSELNRDIDKESTALFNKLLDKSAQLRGQMPSATVISLQAALDGLWERAKAAASTDTQQQHLQHSQQQQPDQAGAQASEQVQSDSQGQRQPWRPGNGRGGAQAAGRGKQQRLAEKLSHDEGVNLLMNWHMANNEFSNAQQLRLLSMRHWDLDDQYDHTGAHVFLPGGNLRLLQGLAKDIPILYKSPAQLIQYCSKGVRVHTDTGVFEADAAIVTVPLGVLKRAPHEAHAVRFQPPLPQRKLTAIKRLGFGCLNKVMLLFPYSFWGDRDMFGFVNSDPDTSQRGRFFLFYTYDGISGGAVLGALVAGDAAISFEQTSQEQSVADLMTLLRSIFSPEKVVVPDPLEAVVTRWASDPMAYGSYSSVVVGSAGPADYEAMARPVGDRLFFAGEATSTRYPATMHGAFDTGMREAANVMAMLAQARGEEGRPKLRQHIPEADPQEATKGRALLAVSAALGEVFGNGEEADIQQDVDMEFGALRAMFGPAGSGLEDRALVQLDLGACQGHPQGQPLNAVYMVLPRVQLEELQDLTDDELRIAAVLELGGSLIGRTLKAGGVALLDAIWRERHGEGLPGLNGGGAKVAEGGVAVAEEGEGESEGDVGQ